jgi:hypothetical protein
VGGEVRRGEERYPVKYMRYRASARRGSARRDGRKWGRCILEIVRQ